MRNLTIEEAKKTVHALQPVIALLNRHELLSSTDEGSLNAIAFRVFNKVMKASPEFRGVYGAWMDAPSE